MKKWLVASLVIVLTAIALLFGPPSYKGWRIRSAIANLKHKDAAIREMAAARLAEIGPQDEDVIAALVDVLVDEKFTSAAVAHALEKIGPPAIPALLDVLEDEDARRRYGVRNLNMLILARRGFSVFWQEWVAPLFRVLSNC